MCRCLDSIGSGKDSKWGGKPGEISVLELGPLRAPVGPDMQGDEELQELLRT